MADRYGSDFITIEDEDGTEFELEVLVTVEYNGCSYLAVIPAVGSDEEMDVVGNLCIIKNVIEGDDEEGILYPVEDEQELEAVYQLVMDRIFEDDEEED